MEISKILRTIDANLNRTSEGLRVLEEIARMVLDDVNLSAKLKEMRHNLIRTDTDFNTALLQARNAAEDVGAESEVSGESKTKDIELMLAANARRVQESLRVLEELSKLPEAYSKFDPDAFQKARFEIYTLERELMSALLRKGKRDRIKGLYVIIDRESLPGKDLFEIAEKLVSAGVKVLQLRDKTTPKGELMGIAGEIQKLCRRSGVLFIINDYIDIAISIKADGVHIGQKDLPAEAVRRLLPINSIMGVSAKTIEEAVAAEKAGADYLGVGSIYTTSTKSDTTMVGIDRISEIKKTVKIPVAAIGGINRDNIAEVIRAGADSACVISAVLRVQDAVEAAKELINIIEETK